MAIVGLAMLGSVAEPLSAQAAPPTTPAPGAPYAGATHMWQGTVYAQSSYGSRKRDGSVEKHAWTRTYRVILVEVPSTTTTTIVRNGNFESSPIQLLIPLSLDYRIEAFTDNGPSVRGPAFGGHAASGSAAGRLEEAHWIRNRQPRATDFKGKVNRIDAPQASIYRTSTWNSSQEWHQALDEALLSPGGYVIWIGLGGSDIALAEERSLYEGIRMTYRPSGVPEIDQNGQFELESTEGFLRRAVLDDVTIFGVMEQPDQSRFEGSHFYNQYSPSEGDSPPQVLVTWDLERVPFRPAVQIEYRQVQNAQLIGPTLWNRHDEFVDFLVGHRQPPIDVRITTIPEATPIRWRIAPRGEHSGRIAPNRGSSKEFSVTPDVTDARPNEGSQVPNRPIAYTLTVHDSQGREELVSEVIQQDDISVLRQEYVDYRRRTATPNVNHGLIPPPRERVVPVEPLDQQRFTLDQGRPVAFGNYETVNLTLEGGWRDLATRTQRAYGGVVNINSAFRNPQRNTQVDGATRSVHMTGGAVDMKTVPRNVTNMVRLHRAALAASGATEILLERAGGGAGGTILLPKNWSPPPATFEFNVGASTIIVVDSDGDDLPDRVEELLEPPEHGLPSTTLLAYDGGRTANPDFQIADTNRNGRIDPMEPLLLVHPLAGRPRNRLRNYYDFDNNGATHVHCATAETPQEQSP